MTSVPVGINCGATCQLSYLSGQNVDLTAAPAPGSRFVGWSNACTGTSTCALTMTSSRAVQATFAPQANVMFVTRNVWPLSAFPTLASADSLCGAVAQDAGLPGNYVAWLSTSTTNARDRLGTGQGWVRTDGRPFARTLTELTSGAILYAPNLDERGTLRTGSTVWTLTSPDGTAGSTCDNLTNSAGSATAGAASGGTSGWTSLSSGPCTTARPFYCFGIDRQAMVAIPDAGSRYAFITKSYWSVDGGVTAADAFCQGEAADAGLSGTYGAMLRTTTAPLLGDRFSLDAGPWVRTDGVRLAPTAAQFAAGPFASWESFPSVFADGTYGGSSGFVWGGPVDNLSVGNCSNWTGATGTSQMFYATGDVGFIPSAPCSYQFGFLMCLKR